MRIFLREAAYSISGPSEISEVSPAGCHHECPVVSSLSCPSGLWALLWTSLPRIQLSAWPCQAYGLCLSTSRGFAHSQASLC